MYGPWRVESASAAASPARWDDGAVRGAVAIPEEDLSTRGASLGGVVRVGGGGAGAAVGDGDDPGRGDRAGAQTATQEVLVWRHPADDGGVTWRALTVRGGEFVGDEREATAREVRVPRGGSPW